METYRGMIDWGIGDMQFKKMLVEFGKLMSVYFVSFPQEHYFILNTVKRIFESCCISGMTENRVLKMIEYGFNCTKNKQPILYTNFEQHIKEATVKQAEFKDAIKQLQTIGTTLNCKKTICIPINGLCIINNNVLPMTQSLGVYPNSRDEFGNIYFGCDDGVDGQATRIAIRELCSKFGGFIDSRGAEPAFYVLNQMSLMFIKGFELDTEHLIELRKLAIIQTSMEVMISKNKYDGIGLYRQWKVGRQLATHYERPTNFHSQLCRDTKINPLQLDEPLWWALMMSMLGLFEEQRNVYDTALMAYGITTETQFHNYIRENFKDKIIGNIELYTVNEMPVSIFTLDNFETTEKVYYLKNHSSINGLCKTHTYYSQTEIENYVLVNGCVWCHHIPTLADFELSNINKINHFDEIKKKLSTCSKLYVPVDIVASSMSFIPNTKFRINMVGITGAGKSTVSKMIYDLVTSKGASCLIVSADKWSKKGHKGKQLQQSIQQEIKQFDTKTTKYKFLIVDICNENGITNDCFGFNTSSYTSINFFPNFDKSRFDEYQCWCLRNVLRRPMHTETSLFWLNPESAGVSTCIKVHNMKTNGLKKQLGIGSYMVLDELFTMEQVMTIIGDKALAYETFLATRDLEKSVFDLIKTTNFPFE